MAAATYNTKVEMFLDMSQKELARHFEVNGRFYAIHGNGAQYPCRDLLEIRRRPLKVASECDAVFIMMNPGSSEPLAKVGPVGLREASMVATKPDTTQYQLMRLMGVLGWSFVKVLNLSDLREPRGRDFYKRFKRFEEVEGHNGHSIFSDARSLELVEGLRRKPQAPVVLAWGVNRALMPLAQNARSALGETPVLGLVHRNGDWAYRHPLPRTRTAQRKWCHDALESLQGLLPGPSQCRGLPPT